MPNKCIVQGEKMGSEGRVLTVYHGSEKIIASPFFGGSKDNNDYGNGFYCSENADLAREWSVDENRDGFLNSYELNLSGLQVLYLNGGSYSILHWLAILLENRRFQITARLPREARRYLMTRFQVPYRDADIIVGYRADDSYFSFAADFLNGTISLSRLEEAMYLGKPGEQIVLKSEKSYRQIRYLDYEPVDASIWYPKREKRDRSARQRYFRQDREGWQKGQLYMPRILDEEIGPDDARIQRIVY
ncbi:MAG: DUF3990 domain-containing protein [Lachnospiraceae bacterium]|nr:DUF3990 domain-containing protein [Lachnospiraceae bacterium]